MTDQLKRAYSIFEMKAFDNDKREFEGIASTPTPDRLGDIVEPKGAVFKLPLPLLWMHRSDQPIGEVFYAKPTASGIPIKGRVFKATESTKLIERLDEAWESIKLKLVRGLSIGFKPIEEARISDTYSFHYTIWDWLELSAVTIPANTESTIQTIKSIDTEIRTASGQRQGVVRLGKNYRSVLRKPGVAYLK